MLFVKPRWKFVSTFHQESFKKQFHSLGNAAGHFLDELDQHHQSCVCVLDVEQPESLAWLVWWLVSSSPCFPLRILYGSNKQDIMCSKGRARLTLSQVSSLYAMWSQPAACCSLIFTLQPKVREVLIFSSKSLQVFPRFHPFLWEFLKIEFVIPTRA